MLGDMKPLVEAGNASARATLVLAAAIDRLAAATEKANLLAEEDRT